MREVEGGEGKQQEWGGGGGVEWFRGGVMLANPSACWGGGGGGSLRVVRRRAGGVQKSEGGKVNRDWEMAERSRLIFQQNGVHPIVVYVGQRWDSWSEWGGGRRQQQYGLRCVCVCVCVCSYVRGEIWEKVKGGGINSSGEVCVK